MSSTTEKTMVFEGECRGCDRTIRTALKPTGELMHGTRFARIRCKECRTTNALEQSDVQ